MSGLPWEERCNLEFGKKLFQIVLKQRLPRARQIVAKWLKIVRRKQHEDRSRACEDVS